MDQPTIFWLDVEDQRSFTTISCTFFWYLGVCCTQLMNRNKFPFISPKEVFPKKDRPKIHLISPKVWHYIVWILSNYIQEQIPDGFCSQMYLKNIQWTFRFSLRKGRIQRSEHRYKSLGLSYIFLVYTSFLVLLCVIFHSRKNKRLRDRWVFWTPKRQNWEDLIFADQTT
jgi:hypothetical protein